MNNCFQRILFWLDIFLLCFCLSLLYKSRLNVCKSVCLKTIFLSFSYLFSWLPVSKYVCMYICLKDCSQTCLKTFFRVYKKTLTHVRLTINFIPSDKNISLFCFSIWASLLFLVFYSLISFIHTNWVILQELFCFSYFVSTGSF